MTAFCDKSLTSFAAAAGVVEAGAVDAGADAGAVEAGADTAWLGVGASDGAAGAGVQAASANTIINTTRIPITILFTIFPPHFL
jgi:hypothetical protein